MLPRPAYLLRRFSTRFVLVPAVAPLWESIRFAVANCSNVCVLMRTRPDERVAKPNLLKNRRLCGPDSVLGGCAIYFMSFRRCPPPMKKSISWDLVDPLVSTLWSLYPRILRKLAAVCSRILRFGAAQTSPLTISGRGSAATRRRRSRS